MERMELVRKVGDGSVVEAFFGTAHGQHYLVQLSRPELGAAADAMGRFLDRSTQLSKELHPELLTPHHVTMTDDGRFVLRSEPITGWTAADLLRTRGPVPEPLVVEWGVSICEALAALHERRQTHGCLAPRHLHLHGDASCPAVRLVDTTLLHFRAEHALAPKAVTVVEPEYLSPERATGTRGSIAGDIWGVGALLVELLTGRAPFRGATPEMSRTLASRARVPRLAPAWARWREVFEGTLDPLPVQRFGSVLELRQALLALV